MELVTGGSGFISSYLAETLCQGRRMWLLDQSPAGKR